MTASTLIGKPRKFQTEAEASRNAIKDWNPKCEAVVGLALTHHTAKQISQKLGYSIIFVKAVLADNRAQVAKEEAIKRVRDYYTSQHKHTIEEIGGLALNMLHEAFSRTDYPVTVLPAILAQANRFLDISGSIAPDWVKKREEGSQTNIQNAIIIPKEQINGLIEGMKRADDVARRLTKPKEIPADVR